MDVPFVVVIASRFWADLIAHGNSVGPFWSSRIREAARVPYCVAGDNTMRSSIRNAKSDNVSFALVDVVHQVVMAWMLFL